MNQVTQIPCMEWILFFCMKMNFSSKKRIIFVFNYFTKNIIVRTEHGGPVSVIFNFWISENVFWSFNVFQTIGCNKISFTNYFVFIIQFFSGVEGNYLLRTNTLTRRKNDYYKMHQLPRLKLVLSVPLLGLCNLCKCDTYFRADHSRLLRGVGVPHLDLTLDN